MRIVFYLCLALSFVCAPVEAGDDLAPFRNTTWSMTGSGDSPAETGKISVVFGDSGASLLIQSAIFSYEKVIYVAAKGETPAMIILRSESESKAFGDITLSINEDEGGTCLKLVGEDAPEDCFRKEVKSLDKEEAPGLHQVMALPPFYRSLRELKEVVALLSTEKVDKVFNTRSGVDSIVKNKDGNYEITAGSKVLTIKVVYEPNGLAGPAQFKLVIGKVRTIND